MGRGSRLWPCTREPEDGRLWKLDEFGAAGWREEAVVRAISARPKGPHRLISNLLLTYVSILTPLLWGEGIEGFLLSR